MKDRFIGRWKITEMEMWKKKYIDLVVPGFIEFEDKQQGSFQFGAVKGWLDTRLVDGPEPRVEWSWEGMSDRDTACGRGYAVLKGETLEGRIFIHASDDSWFKAVPLQNPDITEVNRKLHR